MRRLLLVLGLFPFFFAPLARRCYHLYENIEYKPPLREDSLKCEKFTEFLSGSEDVQHICGSTSLISSHSPIFFGEISPSVESIQRSPTQHVGLATIDLSSERPVLRRVELRNVPPSISATSASPIASWSPHGIFASNASGKVYIVAHTTTFSAVAEFIATTPNASMPPAASLCEALTSASPALSFTRWATPPLTVGTINDVVEGPVIPPSASGSGTTDRTADGSVTPPRRVIYVSEWHVAPPLPRLLDTVVRLFELLLPLTRVHACWEVDRLREGGSETPSDTSAMCRIASRGYYVANGVAVSDSGRTLFVADSVGGGVWALDIATDEGCGADCGGTGGYGIGLGSDGHPDVVVGRGIHLSTRATVGLVDNIGIQGGSLVVAGMRYMSEAVQVFLLHKLPKSKVGGAVVSGSATAVARFSYNEVSKEWSDAQYIRSWRGGHQFATSSAAFVSGFGGMKMVVGSPIDPQVVVCGGGV